MDLSLDKIATLVYPVTATYPPFSSQFPLTQIIKDPGPKVMQLFCTVSTFTACYAALTMAGHLTTYYPNE